MSDEKAVVELPPTDLSVQLTDNAISQLHSQRNQLKKFIQNDLKKDVDYGTIPGTPKPTLYKAGAEKVAGIFKLGSRIVSKDRTLDHDKGFAMFSYTIEVFHIPSGNSVSQCEGSANSKEKKYASRPMTDMLNTLQKMAQKRAYVGAVIIAVGASDYFTQDLEDMDLPKPTSNHGSLASTLTNRDASVKDDEYIFTFGKFRNMRVSEVSTQELKNYSDFLPKLKDQTPMLKEAVECMKMELQLREGRK